MDDHKKDEQHQTIGPDSERPGSNQQEPSSWGLGVGGPSLFTPSQSLERRSPSGGESSAPGEYSLEPVTYVRGVAYYLVLGKTPPELISETQIQLRGGGIRRSLKNSPDVLIARNPGDEDISAPSVRKSQSIFEESDPEVIINALQGEKDELMSLLCEERKLRDEDNQQRARGNKPGNATGGERKRSTERVPSHSSPKTPQSHDAIEHQSPPMTVSSEDEDGDHSPINLLSVRKKSQGTPPPLKPGRTPRVTFDEYVKRREEADKLYDLTPKQQSELEYLEEQLARGQKSRYKSDPGVLSRRSIETEIENLKQQIENMTVKPQGHSPHPRYPRSPYPPHTPPNTPSRSWDWNYDGRGDSRSVSSRMTRSRGYACAGGESMVDDSPRWMDYSTPDEPAWKRAVMDPPRFDGKGELRDYLAHFNVIAELNRWSYREGGIRLAACMTDEARAVVSSMTHDEATDYDTLVRALRCRYEPAGIEGSYAAELSSRVCRENESVAEYGWSLRRLVHKAYPSERVPDRCVVDMFIKGLPSKELRRHVHLAKPQTVEEAIAVATAFEAFETVGKSERTHRKPRADTESHHLRQVSDHKNKKNESKNTHGSWNRSDQVKSIDHDSVLLKKLMDEFSQVKQELQKLQQATKDKDSGKNPPGPMPGWEGRPNGPYHNNYAPPGAPPGAQPNQNGGAPQWGKGPRDRFLPNGPGNMNPHRARGSPWPDKQINNRRWPSGCFQCGSEQHLIRDCPHKNRPSPPPLN